MTPFTPKLDKAIVSFGIVFWMISTLSLTPLKHLCFQMEPTRQVVRHTTAIGASGSPAVLAEMMTYLGYRWHPEYTVFEEYQDFNQEQYRAIVHLYSREYDSTTVLHTAHGVGVTIDMAVHDAAHAALTRLRGEYQALDTSPFRHIPIASDVGAEGYYTAAYSTVTREPFHH